MKWRAKLSTSFPEPRSSNPSSSSAAERGDAGVKATPCGLERLVGLQHNCKLHEVEAAHMDKRAGPLLRRHACCMGKCVPYLAQGQQPERGRQVKRRL